MSSTLDEWERAEGPAGPPTSVTARIDAHVRAQPHAVAVVDGNRRLTYAELDTLAGRLAGRLRQAGVRAESVVGIALPRCAEVVAACLAVWRAGGAYLPIDPDDPSPRTERLLGDAGGSVILASRATAQQLPGKGSENIVMVDDDVGMSGAAALPTCLLDHDQLAYVMYTSGSTGMPKGVAVTHGGIARLVADQAYARFGPDRVVAFAAPLAFDASTFELWGTLAHGGRLVVVPDRVPTPAVLARLVRQEGITTAWLTASLFNLVIDEDPTALVGLQELLIGGEALSVPHVRAALAHLPGTRLVNGYGPTECTTFTTTHAIPEDLDPARPVPIGRPIARTVVRVLDADLGRCAVGAEGELFVGGPGLARGYLGAPAATAERFVPDPYGDEPGARLYRTGDLVRWLADGTLDYRGRADQQVKLRGHRVEPGEVEAALRAEDGVAQAAVVVRGEGSHRTLTAFVVAAADARWRPVELRSRLGRVLPPYLVPDEVVVVPALPLTAGGKIDRRSLAAPPPTRPVEASPRNAVDRHEDGVAAIWADVLRRGPGEVGRHDDFLLVGGNSLLAVQVLSRVRERFGVEVSFGEFLRAPTVAGLARLVATAAPADPLPPLPPVSVDTAPSVPCSFAQERMWFVEQLVPGTPVYNIPVALRLVGPLDRVALRAALDTVVRRHSALRATFAMKDGALGQSFPGGGAHLALHDLGHLQADKREEELHRVLQETASEPFDLAAGPLLRTHLVKLDEHEQEHVLLIVVHHMAADAWSLGIVLRELSAVYESRLRGAPPPLPSAPVHYADIAALERAASGDDVLAHDRDYWRRQLDGVPLVLQLPTDRPRPPLTSLRGSAVRFDLPQPAYGALGAIARQEGATPFTALLALFHLLLHRHSGQEHVLVGLAVANRTRTDVEGVVGPFVNMVPTYTTYHRDMTFRRLVAQLQQRLLDAYEHATLPFERLVESLAPERDPSRHPVVQAFFVQPGDLGAGLRLPDVEVARVPLHPGAAQMDLSLTVEDGDHGTWASLEFATDLFEWETARRMADHFVALLDAVVARPDAPVAARLAAPSDGQPPAVVHHGPTRLLPVAGVHELVAAQAARVPDGVAVVAGESTYTYGELDAAANRLAHHLRSFGVGPDVPVGLMTPRGADMVVALLGILKAGGACVPLDPDYPRERLASMLANAGAPVVVATSGAAAALDPERTPRLVLLDGDAEAIAAHPESAPGVVVDGANLAYVLYTSGSTGVPKGVALEHRNIVSYFVGVDELLADASLGSWLATTSMSFDMSLTELLWPLTYGARVVVGESLRRLHGPTAGRHGLVAGRVDAIQCTPTMARVLLADADAAAVLRELRVLIVSGEEFPVELYRSLRAATDAPIWNVYAPSETTVWSTAGVVERIEGERLSVGAAMVNEAVHVLDDRLEPVPPGTWGEVFIGGRGLSRGYLNRPRETAERFLPDPYSGQPGARMYRSGDRGRLLPDGRVDLHGRMDRQVQLRGNRVELAEIEAVLGEHPAVRASVVTVRELGPHDTRLVAYVEGDGVATGELHEHLRSRLPAYMLPSDIVAVDAFPLTPSGKVDRKALPAPGPRRPMSHDTDAHAPTERLVAETWQEVLGIDTVGPDENFFDAGGNSLLMLHVLALLRERVEHAPRVVDLFRYPTVRLLAAHLERLARDAAARDAPAEALATEGAR